MANAPKLTCDQLKAEAQNIVADLKSLATQRGNANNFQQIQLIQEEIQSLTQALNVNHAEQLHSGCVKQPLTTFVWNNYDPGGVQVSKSASPSNARAESDIAANPNNPLQIVGASKKFHNVLTYDFWLAAYRSADGGFTWSDTELPQIATPEQGNPIVCFADPIVVWDNNNRVYAIGSVFGQTGSKANDRVPLQPGTGVGIAVLTSSDGGATWPTAVVLQSKSTVADSDTRTNDDKPCAAFDAVTNHIVIAWGFQPMIIARAAPGTKTWDVRAIVDSNGNEIPGYAVFLCALSDGSLAISWMVPGSGQVNFTKSQYPPNDPRWNVFQPPTVVASGFTDLTQAFLQQGEAFPNFPGAEFRVESMVTMAASAKDNTIYLFWPSAENNNAATVRYSYSTDAGATWIGPPDGEVLVPVAQGVFLFQPEAAIGGEFGGIACAYFSYDSASGRIDLYASGALKAGETFDTVQVTAHGWDPTVDVIWQHGSDSGGLKFVGDYIGLASGGLGFRPLWMDTRTGIAEMFTARVDFRRVQLESGSGVLLNPSPPVFGGIRTVGSGGHPQSHFK